MDRILETRGLVIWHTAPTLLELSFSAGSLPRVEVWSRSYVRNRTEQVDQQTWLCRELDRGQPSEARKRWTSPGLLPATPGVWGGREGSSH